MCLRAKMLLNVTSIDMMEIRAIDVDTHDFYIFISTRGGGEKLQIMHTDTKHQQEKCLHSAEVLIYEPADWSKESLFEFIEREMLGKYEIEWRTGKVIYEV